jgi:tetratricopeptide (TPR) repeat protein
LGYAYAVAGKRAEARNLLEELKTRSKQTYVPWFYIAGIYAGLGEKDQAIANLERAYEQHEQGLAVMNREPMFDPLRSDARFQELLRRMNLPLLSTPRSAYSPSPIFISVDSKGGCGSCWRFEFSKSRGRRKAAANLVARVVFLLI